MEIRGRLPFLRRRTSPDPNETDAGFVELVAALKPA
jgi:hypothetical protein